MNSSTSGISCNRESTINSTNETTSDLVKKSLKKQLAVRALIKRREQEILSLERLIESAKAKVTQETERCTIKRTQLKESEAELRSMAPTFAGIKEKQQRVRLQLIYLQKVRKKFDQVMKTLGDHELKIRSRSSSGSFNHNNGSSSSNSRLSRSHSTSNGHVTKPTPNKYSFHRSVSEGKSYRYSHKMHQLNEKIGQKKKQLDGEIESKKGLQAQVAATNQELEDKSTRLTSLKAELLESKHSEREVLMISESFGEKLRLRNDVHLEAVHKLEQEHTKLCEDSKSLTEKLESKQKNVTDLEQVLSKLTNELEYLASRALRLDEKSEEEELACTERDMAGKNVKGDNNISDESADDHEDPDEDDQLMMDYDDGCSLEYDIMTSDAPTSLTATDSPERRLNELKTSLQLSLEEKAKEADSLKSTIEQLISQAGSINREAFENELHQLRITLEKTEKEIKQSIATHRKIKMDAMAEKRLLALEAKKKQTKVEECKKACFEAQSRIDENQQELQRLSSELHQLLTSCVPNGYSSKIPQSIDVSLTTPAINIISDPSGPSGKHGCHSNTNSKKLPHSDSPSKGETSSDRLSEPKVKRLRTTSASSSSRHKLSSSHPLSLGNLPSSMSKMYIETKKAKSCSKKSNSKSTSGPCESASTMCTTSAASPPTSPDLSVSRRSSSKESDEPSDDHTDECVWW